MDERTHRKMILTPEDIRAIVDEIEQRRIPHSCRYDIEPDDLRDLMAFVRSFRNASIETRKTFQTMVIRMLVWGFIAGVIGLLASRFGWFRAVARILTIPVPP